MKKLVLLISCYIFSVFNSCHNHGKSAEEKKQFAQADSARVADSIYKSGQVPASGIGGTGDGRRKDTGSKYLDSIAIVHNSQNQEKIDSIKKSKEKYKNPK